MVLASSFHMVVSTLRLFPAHEQRQHTLRALRSVLGPTQTKPHCLCSQLFEEDGFKAAIMYMERWDSEPELHRHIQSDLYNRILAAAELSSAPPEFNFHYVDASRGMDLIEALRSRQLERIPELPKL
jgi:quinol monooxygenase YgiN